MKYILFILLQSVLYGFGNPFTKIGFSGITVFWCLTLRFTLAFLLFLLFFAKRILSEWKQHSPREYLPAGFCMALAYISGNVALMWTTATNVGFLMSLPVLLTAPLATLVLHRKYDLRRLPFQLLVVLGLYLLCMQGGQLAFGKGEIAALVNAVSLSAAMVLSEKLHMDAMAISAVQAGLTALLCFFPALLTERLDFAAVPMISWAVVLYLSILCTCLGYFLQNESLRHLSAQTISMVQCTQPILTAFFSFLLLGERLTRVGLCGAILILLCLLATGCIREKVPEETRLP